MEGREGYAGKRNTDLCSSVLLRCSVLNAPIGAAVAARPVELTHYKGGMALVLEDPGGAPLDRLLGHRPM
jgi:hypothetical protein